MNLASRRSHPLFRAILTSGILAGTIDIGAACLINERSVAFILHTIAGGLLAQRSYSGGAFTATLGLILQWAMSILIAAVYIYAARFREVLRRRWISLGICYGAVIFVVMNYVVVPLSAWRVVPKFSTQLFLENLAAMFVFGLIVAGSAGRLSEKCWHTLTTTER